MVSLAALAVHARSLTFDFTNLDDRDLVVDDHAFLEGLARPSGVLRAFSRSYMHVIDGRHAYYRPLVTLSYAADAAWSGLRPFGYHLTNLALHAVASVLFWLVLRRFALGRAMSLAAALFFAVHPVLASAVAWVPGRNDLLLAVFVLAAWLCFMRDMERPSWVDRSLHLAFFALALLTKETAVCVPLLCAVHVAFTGTWGPPARQGTLVLGWCLALAGRLFASPRLGDATARDLGHGLALLASGLGKLAFPFAPSLLGSPADLVVWPGLVVAAAIAVAMGSVPGIRPRVVALGLSAFAILLAPVLAVPGTLILESRLYLPACGAILAFAEIGRALTLERRTFAASAGVAVVVLAVLTTAYEESFRDRRSFATGAVASAPHSGLAHFCLGQTYQLDGDPARALAEYRLALALGASSVVHNNIAVIHMAGARWADAERELAEQLEIDPGYGRAYGNLAIVLRREGRDDEARAAEDRASELSAE